MAYRNKGDSEEGFKGVFERRVKNARTKVIVLIITLVIGWPMVTGAVISYGLKYGTPIIITIGIIALVLGEAVLSHLISKANKYYGLALNEYRQRFSKKPRSENKPL